jgi:translation initiation factor 2 subunit 1
VAQRSGLSVDKAWEQFGNRLVEVFGTLYGALEETALNEGVLTEEGFEGDWVAAFSQVAKENIVPPPVEIRGVFKLGCNASNGVEIIREALMRASQVEDKEVSISIQYLGAPRYGAHVKALSYKDAEEELKRAQDRVIVYLEEHDGEGTFQRMEV